MGTKKEIVGVKKLPELRSEEVQEVLGWVPPWILRSGISVLVVIVITLFAGSWFYKYPDIIEAPILVTSHNPPVQVNARVNGKITRMLVTDKQSVQASDYLAVVENPANSDDVGALRAQLEAWHEMMGGNHIHFTSDELNRKYELGDIQASYTGFIRAAGHYRLFAELNYYPRRIAAMEEQILKQQQYLEKLQKQYQVVQQQYALAHRQYVRDSSLHVQKMISDAEHDAIVMSFLQSRYGLESSRIALDNAHIQIDQLRQSILDLRLQELEKSGQLQAEVKAGLDNLMNAFNIWEMTYVLKTPVDGTVDVSKFWNVNQNITAGETVFTIIPQTTGQIVGKAQLPIAGSGKVKPGQSVNVRFLNFPDTEYGIVRGVVGNISVVPSGDFYTLEVGFPHKLMTTYGRELPFYQEMYATAEIVTEDLRLLERLFLPLKKIFSEQ
ncbi:MAG: HlyD family secretion protein [Bacteroidales bacterium]|nr:HlyD family secretion protein [Bacteroidales bacterium]MCL2737838.1 HlyD family secretion protein [Bacteroidales bacterium]